MTNQHNIPINHHALTSLDATFVNTVQAKVDKLIAQTNKEEIHTSLPPDTEQTLVEIFYCSEFIADSLVQNHWMFTELITSGDLATSYSCHTYATRVKDLVSDLKNLGLIKKKLLQFKLYEIIRIAWRDLTRTADLKQTLEDLSNLADAIMDITIKLVYDDLSQIHGVPTDHEGSFQNIIVLGMGKLGAHELNFSSDIDLIFVYPETGYTNGEKTISNEEFFTRVCRKFLKLFSQDTQATHFYRIDTRLRPYGSSGPLVMSSAAFEEYYQAQGREWERYALIKARPVAGDIKAGLSLLKTLQPFIYRRYFDYGSFDSFRDMKHRINLQVKNKQLKNNIKLGAGGIREIEFFGQLFQLIRGGVEPELQERKILSILDLLVAHSCIDPVTSKELKDAYVFLRMVENRLQIFNDLQTHELPKHGGKQTILAAAMGYDSFPGFEAQLKTHMQKVHYHFNQLLVLKDEEDTNEESHGLKEMWLNINDPQFQADPKTIGRFSEPQRVLNILRSLESHPNTKQLTFNGRKKLSRLIPAMLKKIGQQEDPEAILIKLIDLVIIIERRTCYLSLLLENETALDTLITLARKSAWIVTLLASHPVLLDELLNPATLYSPPGKKALEKELDRRMAGIPDNDLEFILEQLSVFRQINYLRVAAADISGNYPLMKVSDHLTYIAQTILSQVLRTAWHIMTDKYGIPEGISGDSPDNCRFGIIAYGKVGGFEMGYKSDIDIVFLYKAGTGMTHGKKKSIENILFYSNLGQRIINALTMHTPAGTLYGADMRLRPGGNAGTIVSHIDAFEEYLTHEAWTWEHQALIRARPVAGDPEIAAQFNAIRKNVLTRKREGAVLKKEVSDMREKMRNERLKPEKGIFNLKQSQGGMVDIEFLVQYLILKNAYEFPDITVWTDNIRLLESLDTEGIIIPQTSDLIQKSYLKLRKAIHRLNLQEARSEVPEADFKKISADIQSVYNSHLE